MVKEHLCGFPGTKPLSSVLCCLDGLASRNRDCDSEEDRDTSWGVVGAPDTQPARHWDRVRGNPSTARRPPQVRTAQRTPASHQTGAQAESIITALCVSLCSKPKRAGHRGLRLDFPELSFLKPPNRRKLQRPSPRALRALEIFHNLVCIFQLT